MPMRRLLRPCVRLYQCQHSSATSSPALQPPVTSTLTQASYLGQPDHPCLYYHSFRFISNSCMLCDTKQELAADISRKIILENGEKEKVILSSSFKDLLEVADKVNFHYHAALIIQRLGKLHQQGLTEGQEPEELLQRAPFVKVIQVLDKNMTKMSPKVLLATLEAVYDMTPNDIYLVKTLATQVLWLTRRLPMPLLVQVLQLHLSHQETPLRESIVQQTLSVLERRWVELTSMKDIIYLMYNMNSGTPVSQSLTERLEDRALDVVEQATPKELYRILYLLSRQRHRNTPLIRAILYHLNKAALSSLSAIQLANLAYACCVLNIYDVALLEKVSAELANKKESLSPQLAASLLASFSRLRWSHAGAVQLLLDVVDGGSGSSPSSSSPAKETAPSDDKQPSQSLQALDVSDRVGIVHSLANLNLHNAQCQNIVGRVAGAADVQELKKASPLMWLDVVWSLSVLQRLDQTSAASVLSEDFWGSLPVSDSFQSMITMTKLSNINAAAKYEVEGYTGPFLPDALCNGDAKLLVRGEQKTTQKVLSALANMAPVDSYTVTNITASGGYLIDAEFYVDSYGEPKLLSQETTKSRVALKVLDFPDLTLPTSEPTGLHAMAARHLRHQGYTVVQVLHTEVASKSKVVELVQFLQQKIKEALKDLASRPRS
ncbi:hypothetical protein BaRGS_00027787 [Batillaria attramentaria]|uniref:RAP domain-containing protein n=1 Tax=Batillaria attramentaria TaxID=370345 RepID=A0ABD0K1L9_9CAEN